MRRTLLLSSLLALAACASWFHAKIPPASTRIEPAASAAVWSATFEELQARGFKIAAHDAASGVVRTESVVMPGRVPCGFLQCAYRDAIHVTVAPQGEVGVRIARELASGWVAATPYAIVGGGRWDPPASTQRSTVAGVVADQDALLRAILARSGKAPAAAAPPVSGPAAATKATSAKD